MKVLVDICWLARICFQDPKNISSQNPCHTSLERKFAGWRKKGHFHASIDRQGGKRRCGLWRTIRRLKKREGQNKKGTILYFSNFWRSYLESDVKISNSIWLGSAKVSPIRQGMLNQDILICELKISSTGIFFKIFSQVKK